MIIGITGGSGSGKTTLLEVIRDQGGLVLDCDLIYHELLKTDRELLADIEARFPGAVENGVLQRKKLGAIVFSDPAALRDLNRITHKSVHSAIVSQIDESAPIVAIDAIGLFGGGLDKLCQVTVAVTAPDECRVQRLMARDGITEEYARNRIAAQKPQAEFSALCDYTLVNDSSREAFRDKCLAFLAQLGIINV